MKRITLTVDDELYEQLDRKVPHGFRNHLLNSVLSLLVNAMEGIEPPATKAMLGAVVAGRFKLVEVDALDDR
ncbi:MAG TPA: hypothetical protein VH621_05330 [Nitrososphaera sp.]|jgi:hypothetical protein